MFADVDRHAHDRVRRVTDLRIDVGMKFTSSFTLADKYGVPVWYTCRRFRMRRQTLPDQIASRLPNVAMKTSSFSRREATCGTDRRAGSIPTAMERTRSPSAESAAARDRDRNRCAARVTLLPFEKPLELRAFKRMELNHPRDPYAIICSLRQMPLFERDTPVRLVRAHPAPPVPEVLPSHCQ